MRNRCFRTAAPVVCGSAVDEKGDASPDNGSTGGAASPVTRKSAKWSSALPGTPVGVSRTLALRVSRPEAGARLWATRYASGRDMKEHGRFADFTPIDEDRKPGGSSGDREPRGRLGFHACRSNQISAPKLVETLVMLGAEKFQPRFPHAV